jgi:hypothetical protein
MIATIVWVGGLALMALVVAGGAGSARPGPELATLIRRLQQRWPDGVGQPGGADTPG